MILHLIETGGPGGAEQMLLRLAEAYRKRGRDQVVCLRKDGWLADQVRRRELPLHIVPQGRVPDLAWVARMRSLARSLGVAAIHSHEFAMNVHAALLARVLGVPVAATVHGKAYYGDRFARRLAYRCASRAAKLVAVSEDIRAFLSEKVGIPKARIGLIRNGVDIERFAFDGERRTEMRNRLGVTGDEVLIGAVGSYYPVKGHRYLIEAAVEVCRRAPAVKVVVAGQGPLESELRQRVSELGLDARVNVCGYVEDVPGFMSALDVFVMPSLSEGLPLALLEAAANGRALVASAVGGIPEVLSEPGVGVLVPAADSGALADALLRLAGDQRSREEMGRRANRLAASRWSFDDTVTAYLGLLA